MSAMLKLTHKAIGAEVRRGTYDVVVDGDLVGSVEMNNTIEMPVEPGRHALQAMAESRAVPKPSTPPRARSSPSDAPERGSCRSFWRPSSVLNWH